MESITLKSQNTQGDILEAIFLPDKGMNMVSFKRDGVQVIDQSTRSMFEERFAGLGALIGPHFHHRNPDIIPQIKDESLFPHIARVKAKGVQEPFSHGIARYAPWQAKATDTKISATLTGKDTWNGVALSALEGQNFKMQFSAELTPQGLQLELSVVSDTDSVVGIHYYYHLPKGTATVISGVQTTYIENNQRKPLPGEWNLDNQQVLRLPLDRACD